MVESALGVVEVPAQGGSIRVPPLDLWEQHLQQSQPLAYNEGWTDEKRSEPVDVGGKTCSDQRL